MRTRTKIILAATAAYLAVGVAFAIKAHANDANGVGPDKEPYSQVSFQKACNIYNGNTDHARYHCEARSNGVKLQMVEFGASFNRQWAEPACKRILKWLKDGTEPGTIVVTIASHYDSISCDNKPSED
jgi:hypothetical protein